MATGGTMRTADEITQLTQIKKSCRVPLCVPQLSFLQAADYILKFDKNNNTDRWRTTPSHATGQSTRSAWHTGSCIARRGCRLRHRRTSEHGIDKNTSATMTHATPPSVPRALRAPRRTPRTPDCHAPLSTATDEKINPNAANIKCCQIGERNINAFRLIRKYLAWGENMTRPIVL
ncbi:hypothetical protein WA026_003570 [Henosepilachna vigintioctopunctata]|uniref:Uncharacterized protein n=1 Tax=Henosepilachna vigintioctopunctata TaxID=420089 RepID=A0AAW1TNH1_9CUCU